MKSTTYIAEITFQKAEKYLSEGIKLESTCLLACLPTCLFTSCQPRNFLHDFTEQCFALSDQSSCAINLTWYLFFCEFYSIIIFLV